MKPKIKNMQARCHEFASALNGLTLADIQNAADFPAWCYQWGAYIVAAPGADRPPVKPPTP